MKFKGWEGGKLVVKSVHLDGGGDVPVISVNRSNWFYFDSPEQVAQVIKELEPWSKKK